MDRDIVLRVIYRVDSYSPAANACSTGWAPEFSDFEMASDFLWRHLYQIPKAETQLALRPRRVPQKFLLWLDGFYSRIFRN